MFRIQADCPCDGEFVHVELPRHLHELDAHDGVLVEVGPRIFAVRTDPTHRFGEMDHSVGAQVGERPADFGPLPEVVLVAPGHEDLDVVRARFQLLDEVAAKEARPPGDHDGPTCPEVCVGHHQSTRPYQASLLLAYQWIVRLIPSSQQTLSCHPVSSGIFSCPTRGLRRRCLQAGSAVHPGRCLESPSIPLRCRCGGSSLSTPASRCSHRSRTRTVRPDCL